MTLDDVGFSWVYYELLPHVEEQWEQKAFIMDRDALVGPFLEEATAGIFHSEKVLFVVTNDFLRNYQWPIILHWAVDTSLQNLIVVLIDIKIRSLPPYLAKVTMSLEKKFPSNVIHCKNGYDEPETWNKLKIALTTSKTRRNPSTSSGSWI